MFHSASDEGRRCCVNTVPASEPAQLRVSLAACQPGHLTLSSSRDSHRTQPRKQDRWTCTTLSPVIHRQVRLGGDSLDEASVTFAWTHPPGATLARKTADVFVGRMLFSSKQCKYGEEIQLSVTLSLPYGNGSEV